MLSKPLIIPVALFWTLTNLSTSLEKVVPKVGSSFPAESSKCQLAWNSYLRLTRFISFNSPQNNVAVPKKTLCSWVILDLCSTVTLDSFSAALLPGQLLLALYLCVWLSPPWKQCFTLIFIESDFRGLRSVFQFFTIIFKLSYALESTYNLPHSQDIQDFVMTVYTVWPEWIYQLPILIVNYSHLFPNTDFQPLCSTFI